MSTTTDFPRRADQPQTGAMGAAAASFQRLERGPRKSKLIMAAAPIAVVAIFAVGGFFAYESMKGPAAPTPAPTAAPAAAEAPAMPAPPPAALQTAQPAPTHLQIQVGPRATPAAPPHERSVSRPRHGARAPVAAVPVTPAYTPSPATTAPSYTPSPTTAPPAPTAAPTVIAPTAPSAATVAPPAEPVAPPAPAVTPSPSPQ